ncbi:hypothetical protein JAAARDRAFT_181043 [Jaapia argillacea MUCL 33604]|uniref:Peroxisomal ATPase PEX1 n=1 Tax=Jaapia argillacea MUCL 33604 TaxID=933084 RepID=A0A067PMK0_9AGAM|nr:hypothetical protein JAAARDRAFT_181043 [Jaapia argillacea MUCL 33604]
MPRRARIHYVSLHSSLVNLPISIYGPLLERNIRPQNLAVHLKLFSDPTAPARPVDPKPEAYVGWTGMASASSLAHFNNSQSAEKGLETIEIDPQFAQSLGLSQGAVVDIGLLYDLPSAKSVATEPISTDDWEIIELHATHVEATLLSQVRVASIGQEIDVWVLGRTRVRLKVVSVDPPAKSNALLLTTTTEVSIAPKLRKSKAGAKSSASVGKPSTKKDGSVSGKSASGESDNRSRKLRVLPYTLFQRRQQQPSSSLHPAYDPSLVTAYVAPNTFHDLTGSPYPSSSSNLPIHSYRATVKRLFPPPDPTSTQTPAPPSPTPAPRVLNPASGSASEKDSGKPVEESGKGEIILGYSHLLPDSHIAFSNALDGLEEWDNVWVTTKGVHKPLVPLPALEDEPASRDISPNPPLNSEEDKVLAGVDDILDKCKKFCFRTFLLHTTLPVVRGVDSLLLTGKSGFGKTSIIQAVAKSLQEDPQIYAHTHYVDVSKLAENPISTLKPLFEYWYDQAAWHRPSILILDNLEKLLSAEQEHIDSFRTRHLTQLFLSTFSSSARQMAHNTKYIILLATAESQTALHPLLNQMHLFKESVHLKPPGKEARRDILSQIVQRRLSTATDLAQDPTSPLNFTSLATTTEGYSAIDLQDLVARAIHQAIIRSQTASKTGVDDKDNDRIMLTRVDFEAAQVDFTPLNLRDVQLQKSEVAWADIGGLTETRRVLRETLEWPTKYGPIFAQSPLRLRSGLLLYGYPGCGKTLLASAVAKECGLNFISVKGPEILNKYIGASEKSVRDLFERASAAKPCVLFFDEFDSIAPKRGHDSTGVTDRVVNQMLTQLDGVEGLDGVYVLAATSRPDLIDPALLRPGRLDKSLLCDMPNIEDRKEILEAVARKVPMSSSVDFEELARLTEGYSGADLQALVYNAQLEVIHTTLSHPLDTPKASSDTREEETDVEYVMFGGPKDKAVLTRAEQAAVQRRINQILSGESSGQGKKQATALQAQRHEIQPEHLQNVLKTMRPSVSAEERARLEAVYGNFTSDRSGDLPHPPDAGGIGNRVSLM